MAATAVRVALRVRPLTQKEQLSNCTECVSFIPDQPQILIGKDYSFTYDYVFDPRAQQRDIYNACVSPLVEKYVEGFNATILAYGQTGSGKTYSMGTAIDGNLESEENQGIVPRFISDLYTRLEQKKESIDNFDYNVFVSFLELYNEDLVDLLNVQDFSHQRRRTYSSGSSCDISIREDIHGNIYWSGVREEPCQNPHDLINYLAKGSLCRATGSTDMNAVSSRSHAIFSVILKQRLPDEDNGSEKTVVSKFHFVDLAGSERLKRTKAQGDRAREGIAINSGLLALGNVISALGDESRRSTHIPYRDSKLTRLLQDSLGGNSQTLMMACISPSDSNFVETLSTLKYANRVRNIKNKVSVNQEFAGSSVEVNQLRAQVAKLKMELNTLRATAGVVSSGDSLKKNNEIEALRQEVNKLRDRVQVASDELCQVTAERDTLLLERELTSSGQELPRLLEELMHADESSRNNSSSKLNSLPIIEQYQKTIKDLRNELADTQERLAFMEATRAPVMHALSMQSNLSPAASAKPSNSATPRRRRVRGPGNSVTTRGNHVTFKSSRSSKTPKSRKNLPPPPQPIRASTTDDSSVDIEQWLQDAMGSIKYPESDDIRNEVRDSISRARAEIERGMQVLEAVKPREHDAADQHHHHKNQEYDLMDEADLFAALQSKDNEFLFTDLEHEMLDDIESTSPPPDWHLDNDSDMNTGGGHSRQSSGGLSSTADESEIAAMCQENPHLSRIIQQVQADIRVKEELVNQLEKCEHDYVELHKRFEHKLYSLKQEILSLKRDRDRVMRRNSFSRNDAMAQKERQQLLEVKHAYEMKIKSLMVQLSEWQRKYAQTTSSSQASRNHNESIIRSLRVSVESLKLERRRLIKRSKEEKERSKEQMHAHQREIQQLRNKQLRDAERRRRLERENKQVQLMLQKRTDEVVLTNDKLKKLIHIVKKAVREGGVLDERQVSKCADLLQIGSALVASSNARLSSAHKRRSGKKASKASIQERAAKKKMLLDRALTQFIVGKQAVIEMEQLMAKREELSQKQEEILRERERSYYASAAERYLDEERYEAIAAELAYLNERIRALQNDAAHEIMQEEEEDEYVDMDLQQQQQQQKPAKRVTFADEVMGYTEKDLGDEWLDMDALEEKYTLPPNADPEAAHEMALKLIQSVTLDEAEKIMEALINDVASLKMEEYQRETQIMHLEKSMQDLQRTLTVMRDKAVRSAIESEKKIKRLEQGSRRSSLSTICVSDDNDSAIDLRVEEQYQQFGTIFDKIYSQGMTRTGSERSGSPVPCTPKNASGSPILPPMRPQSLIEKPPSSPSLAAAANRRNSMSSPDQFLQHLIQTGLLSPMVRQAPSPVLKPFTRDTESSTSSIRSSDLRRRSSIQSDNMSWSSHDSSPPHQKPIQIPQAAPTILNRRRARSLQQQQRPSPLILSNKQQRRFSLRELSLQQQQQHQPSPLQQQFVVPDSPTVRSPTPNGHNVFDRLATIHTKASQAKRASTPVPL